MLQEKWTKVTMIALIGLMCSGLVSEAAAQAPQQGPNKGLAAIDHATKANKYTLIFFYRQDDPQTKSLGEVFNGAAKALAARADSVVVRITDPSEADIVNKFQVTKAPMPLGPGLGPQRGSDLKLPRQFHKGTTARRVRYSFNGKTSRHITARETSTSVPSKWQDSMECRSDERSPGL